MRSMIERKRKRGAGVEVVHRKASNELQAR